MTQIIIKKDLKLKKTKFINVNDFLITLLEIYPSKLEEEKFSLEEKNRSNCKKWVAEMIKICHIREIKLI